MNRFLVLITMALVFTIVVLWHWAFEEDVFMRVKISSAGETDSEEGPKPWDFAVLGLNNNIRAVTPFDSADLSSNETRVTEYAK